MSPFLSVCLSVLSDVRVPFYFLVFLAWSRSFNLLVSAKPVISSEAAAAGIPPGQANPP